MKKQLFILPAFLLLAFNLSAQEVTKTTQSKKCFLALTGGPSIPVGKYGLKDVSEPQAGYARFGYNLNLNFGYMADKNFGIASSVIFGRHKLNIDEIRKSISEPNLTVDHYQYYGILAGPMGSFNLSDKVLMDVKVMAGIAEANSPVFRLGNQVTSDKWNEAFTWQYGTDIRYNVNPTTCIFTNIYYNHMKPSWNFGPFTNSGSEQYVKVEQNMGVLDFSFGVGMNF